MDRPILLAVVLAGACACGPTPLDQQEIDALVNDATRIGAAQGLWSPTEQWSGWTFRAVPQVNCGGSSQPPLPGEVFGGCTNTGDRTVTILDDGHRSYQDKLIELEHELYHVAVGQGDHCRWSANRALIMALYQTQGSGGNFYDACLQTTCEFQRGLPTCSAAPPS